VATIDTEEPLAVAVVEAVHNGDLPVVPSGNSESMR
jgi:hypothetical protein